MSIPAIAAQILDTKTLVPGNNLDNQQSNNLVEKNKKQENPDGDHKISRLNQRILAGVNQNPPTRVKRSASDTPPVNTKNLIFQIDDPEKQSLGKLVTDSKTDINNLINRFRIKNDENKLVIRESTLSQLWLTEYKRILADLNSELSNPSPHPVRVRLILEDLKDLSQIANAQFPQNIESEFGPADSQSAAQRGNLINSFKDLMQKQIRNIDELIIRYPTTADYSHSNEDSVKHGPVVGKREMAHITEKSVKTDHIVITVDNDDEGDFKSEWDTSSVIPGKSKRWTEKIFDCTNYQFKGERTNRERTIQVDIQPLERVVTIYETENGEKRPGSEMEKVIPAEPPPPPTIYKVKIPQKRIIEAIPNEISHFEKSEYQEVFHNSDTVQLEN